MKDMNLWFTSEVEKWRTGASVAWTVLLLPIITFTVLTLAHVDLLSPHTWIIGCIYDMFSPRSWSYITIMTIVIAAVALWDAQHFSVKPKVLSNRWAYIWNILSPQRMIQVVTHAVAAAIITWCYLQMVGGRFSNLSLPCLQDDRSACLNEHHLFLVLHGVCVGLVYILHLFLTNNSHLTFPIVQQSKFFQVKSNIYPLVIAAVKHTITYLRYLYLAYYILLGSLVKRFILSSLNLRKPDEPLRALTLLLDVGLLWQAVLSGTLVYLLLTLSALLYRVYQTQAFQFMIESPIEEDKNRCLVNAMSCTKHPLVQYLGFQDLYLLSKHCLARRQEIFSLSQPGGHPHNWNGVSSQCLASLQSLAEAVKDFNNRTLTSGPARQISGDKPAISTGKAGGGAVSSSLGVSTAGSLPGTPVTNLSYRGAPPGSTLTSPFAEAKPPSPSFSKKVWEELKKRKAIAFFVKDLPDAPSKKLFVDCQLHIWAVEALSYLSTASYKEDSYGVVQKSLADILTTLLSLHESVEKHLRLVPPSVNRKGGKGSQPNSDVSLRYALRSAIKSAIYRIVGTFDKHLSSVQLSTEHSRKLRQFQDYKEG